jgi:hypothetical protein
MISVTDKLPNFYNPNNYYGIKLFDYKFRVKLQTGRLFWSCFNFDTGQWVITEKKL